MAISAASAFFSFRQFDNESLELANGWMYVYKSGTSTLVQLYDDYVGTPRANPVQLDGSGKAYFFGDQHACKVVITDVNGVQIDEADPVWLFGQGTGDGNTGTGAIVGTYNDLRALTKDYDLVTVLGNQGVNDGGFGEFEHVPTSVAADDNGITLIRQGSSRYIRQYKGYVDPRWFGLVYGGTVDQIGKLQLALAAGPTALQGYTYMSQDAHLTGRLAIFSGGFTTGGTPKLYLDGKLDSVCAGAFGAGINVIMGKSVTTEIRTSWFANVNQSLSSIYSYPYLVDSDTQVSSNLTIPYNYRVDFPNGSLFNVTANAAIDIENLVYAGNSQIIKYGALSYVSSVKVGQGACLLEWFGGISGAGIGVDNTIPAKAAFAHGNIKLVDSLYRVGNVDAGWTFTHGLTLTGSNLISYCTLDLSQSVTVTDFQPSYVNLIGSATITSTGTAVVDHVTVPATDAQNSTTTQDINAGTYLPPNYFVSGNGGVLRNSTDLTSWTSYSAGAGPIRSIAKGPVWIGVSDSGVAFRSTDGGATWTPITIGTQSWYKVKWIRGQFVLCGTNGGVYVSADGVTWNNRSIASVTATLRDFDYSTVNNIYIFVGTAATVYTSADLVSYTLRALPSGVTGDLYAVASFVGSNGTTTTIISGALGGGYLIASDSVSYLQLQLGTSETIYSISVSPTTILLTGGLGNVYTSTSAGQQFTKQAVAGGAGLSSAYSNGQWILGAAGGYVWSTADLKTWASHYIGVASDVLAVYIGAPVYATVGNSNTVQTSATGSGKDWKAITIDGSTANWYNVRIWNGMAFLCGASGRLFITTDFVNFVSVNTGIATDIYDIVYNSTAQKYALCGASGVVRWCTKADILTPTPTWNAVTTGTTNTLTRAAWTGTLYVFTGVATVVTSTDLTGGGTGVINNVINGMLATPISGGNLYILYGNSGLILTSTDRVSWTKQISGTTNNLLSGIVQGGFACIGGSAGVMLRADITNIATWASISVGTSQNINAFKYNTGRNELGLCGNAGTAYKSTNNGLTWTSMATGSGQDMYDLWGNGTSWECCGNNGAWYTSADAVSWTMRETSVRAGQPYPTPIRCGVGNVAFGDDGWIGYADGKPTVHSQQNRFGMRGINFVRLVNNTLLTSTGATYAVTYGPDHDGTNSVSCIGGTNLADAACTNLCADTANNSLYAVGGSSIWYTNSASNYMFWTQKAQAFAGVRDMQYRLGWLYAVGDNGLVIQSSNAQAWTTNAQQGDTTTRYSVDYYQAQGVQGTKTGITTYVAPIGGNVVLAGFGGLVWSGASPTLPALVLANSTITYSNIQTPITASSPAVVRNSFVGYLDKAASLTDVTVTRGVGTLYGNMLRSTMALYAPVAISGNILISESALNKTAPWDLSNTLFSSISGTTLQIDSTSLEYSGMLIYSEDTSLKIKLNACSNSSNFAGALTNGFAKVTLLNCNATQNSTAYNIDGSILDTNVVTLAGSQAITGATTDWSGLPAGTTSDGTSLTLTAQAYLGSSPTGPTTLRWHGTSSQLHLLQNLGGRIKTEITYPAGYTPDSTSPIKVALVRPSLVMAWHPSVEGETVIGPTNDGLVLGSQTPIPTLKAGAKIVAYTNVWGGYSDLMLGTGPVGSHTTDPWSDVDTDRNIVYSVNSARVVVYSGKAAVLPIGTTIKITMLPQLPYAQADFAKWFNAPDRSIDSKQQVERQQLSFIKADPVAGIEVAYTPVAGTSTPEDIKWLSLTTSGGAYSADGQLTTQVTYTFPFGNSGVYTATFQGIIKTDKSVIYSGMVASGVNIRFRTVALADSTWNTFSPFYPTTPTRNKFDGYNIANAAWNTLSQTRVILP